MSGITLKDRFASPPVAGKLDKPGLIDVIKKDNVKKNEGIDELLQCLNPATFDLGCIITNIDWLVNNALNSLYLNCSLGTATPDPGDSGRRISSGACHSWWGIPPLAQAQKCNTVPPALPVTTCQNKCVEVGGTYEAAGCDLLSLWCWCRVD
jgi:hypothetical protein